MNTNHLQHDAKTGLSYELVIGIETHVQVLSRSKAFCACENRYGGMPNSRVCPVCLGLPGALPRVNSRLYEAAILAGAAFGCQIATRATFVRKNYMYPDLTKGYQITQKPQICQGGYLNVLVNGMPKRIGLVGLHMEEDVGKSLHLDDDPYTAYIDYNRCGAPLLEIVSEPCMHGADEVVAYAHALREIVRHLGISNGDMEEGSLRCDANINLRIHRDGQIYPTPIAEIKNMNSFKAIRRAVEYEIQRQLAQWQETGITLKDEEGIKTTRNWDDKTGCTVFMRSKGPLDDYRFFVDPDLPSILVPQDWVAQLATQVGELPVQTRERLKKEYELSDFDCEMITQSRSLILFYEQAVKYAKNPKRVANWLLTELMAVLKDKNLDIAESPVTPENLAALTNVIEEGQINGKQAKDVFVQMIATGTSAQQLIKDLDLSQVCDVDAIKALALEVLEENPQAIADYKSGKDNALKYLMGQLMKKSKGKAKPDFASAILEEHLGFCPGKQ